ncbi:MAG: hypothetical protein WCO63_02460 [Bacteroidota bacterium]
MKRISGILLIILSVIYLNSCIPDTVTPGGDSRDPFLGTWTVQENGKKKVTYQVTITADPSNSVQVLISNFYNFGIQPYAIATSSTLTIPTQEFPAEGIKVWGSGSYSDKKMTWVYYVNDGANQDTIHSVYTLN